MIDIGHLLLLRGRPDYPQARAGLLQLLARYGIHKAVLGAMGQVPRHAFLPRSLAAVAYTNQVCVGDTNLTDPLCVARMTQYLELTPAKKVLEIGTGTGYQTAILALLTRQVFTIERVRSLVQKSCEAIRALGLHNVHQRFGDGHQGWPDAAPFDAIIAAAAAVRTPERLVQQLNPCGGRLVMPIGPQGGAQRLYLIQRWQSQTQSCDLGPVCFVPFIPGATTPRIRRPGASVSRTPHVCIARGCA